ncbi:MAG TPA: hypothetical protein VIK07_06200 [Bacteroidales bacterium]
MNIKSVTRKKLQTIPDSFKLFSLAIPAILVVFLISCKSTLDSKEDILARIKAPTFSDKTFKITDFGAVADSISDWKQNCL